MSRLIARFIRSDTGATAIEYALIAGLIAVGIIGGAAALGTGLNTKLTGIAGMFTASVP